MVNEYLQSNKTLLEEKLRVREIELDEKNSQWKKQEQYIQRLEQDVDGSRQAFSPREVNSKKHARIGQLKEEQFKIKARISELESEISELQRGKDKIVKVIDQYERERTHNQSIRILKAQEEERKRIAMELHDDTVQRLTSIIHKTDLCSKLIQLDPIRCKLELMAMSNTIRSIIEDMRKMIYDLRPMSFDDIGFDVTVERMLEKIQRDTETKVRLKCEQSINRQEQIILITLLRIVMEAVNNAIKYAKAENVSVDIFEKNEQITLKISDDGAGFDIEEVMNRKRHDNTGFGLKIMKERVALLSGQMNICTEIGKGTIISVNVPTCKEEEM